MYQALLTRRYLFSKVMPLLAAVAVALCTAMVLIVWSVMGGFLKTLLEQGRSTIGDVSITYDASGPYRGIGHYDDLITLLEADPMVEAATPVLETFGLISANGGRTQGVLVIGVEPEGYHRVTNYNDRVYWQMADQPSGAGDVRVGFSETFLSAAEQAAATDEEQRFPPRAWVELASTYEVQLAADGRTIDTLTEDELAVLQRERQDRWTLRFVMERIDRATAQEDFKQLGPRTWLTQATQTVWQDLAQSGITITKTATTPEGTSAGPAIVPGIDVLGMTRRNTDGVFVPNAGLFAPDQAITLTVLPTSERGVPIEPVERRLPIANEFRSGMYQTDSASVLMPLGELQKMLKLDQAQRFDPDFRPGRMVMGDDGVMRPAVPQVIGEEPARASSILIKATDGVLETDLRERAAEIYVEFAKQFTDVPPAGLMATGPFSRDHIYTWEDKPDLRVFIGAVKKETGLVLVLFAFISLTAVFLVFAIFWSMISEKTKDIGILRAMGAGTIGIAWLFLRYGLAIGILGSAIGGVIALLVVSNINAIHKWMGEALGITVWDPQIYAFTEIPSDLQPSKVVIVLTCGVLASALGALVPAFRAASMDPVKAIRFE